MITSSKMSSAPASALSAAEQLEEAGGRWDDTHVGGDRLGQHGGHVVLGQGASQRGAVVPVDEDGRGRLGDGDPGARRDAQGRQARAGIGEQAVGVAVVGAGELDDDLAPGSGAGEADGAHRSLGAGAGHAQHLDRGDAIGDLLGKLDLGGGWGAVGGAAPRRLDQRGEDRGVGVAEDQRPPGADPVEVAVAVDIDQLTALTALDEDRLAADLAHRPDGGVDAAREDLQRSLIQLRRCGQKAGVASGGQASICLQLARGGWIAVRRNARAPSASTPR